MNPKDNKQSVEEQYIAYKEFLKDSSLEEEFRTDCNIDWFIEEYGSPLEEEDKLYLRQKFGNSK